MGRQRQNRAPVQAPSPQPAPPLLNNHDTLSDAGRSALMANQGAGLGPWVPCWSCRKIRSRGFNPTGLCGVCDGSGWRRENAPNHVQETLSAPANPPAIGANKMIEAEKGMLLTK